MVAEAPSPPPTPSIPDALPVLPLGGGTVVFPMTVVPLAIGEPRSVQLVDDAMRRERLLGLVSQRTDQPDDLYRVGTAGVIRQLARSADGILRVLVQGLERVRVVDFVAREPYLVARLELSPDHAAPGVETEALRRAVVDLVRRLVPLTDGLAADAGAAADALTDPRQLVYLVASAWPLPGPARQEILELDPVDAKLRRLIELLQRELAVRELGQQITDATRERMSKAQRDVFLREQLGSIQRELAEDEDYPGTCVSIISGPDPAAALTCTASIAKVSHGNG